MFYSQRENIWFRLFYPRLKVVSEKHWLCHYQSGISFITDQTAHLNICLMSLVMGWSASGLLQSSVSVAGSAYRLSLSPAFYGWCFDQTTSEFSTVFQSREETPHFSVMTSQGLVMKSQHHCRVTAVQSQWPVGYRVELSHTVVPYIIPYPKIVRSAYKLSSGVTSTASEQAQHPISVNVRVPPKLICDQVSRAPSYTLHQGGWKLSLYWSSDLNTLTSGADPKKPGGCIPSVNDGEISPKGKITFRYCGVWWSTGLFQ